MNAHGETMRMNQRGNVTIATAVILLVSAVIGLWMVDDVCSPWCNCVDATSITKTLIVNEYVNDTCEGTKCDTDYSVTCNSTELEVGTEYDIVDCDVQLTNATWNNTECTLAYTIEGDNYHGDDVTGMVVCNIPLIAGITILVLAGGFAFLKGGL